MASEKLEAQYKELDGQIESLMKCTPLPEAEVKVLCEKAREILQVLSPEFRPEDFESALNPILMVKSR